MESVYVCRQVDWQCGDYSYFPKAVAIVAFHQNHTPLSRKMHPDSATATVRGFGEVATSVPLIARASYRYRKRSRDRETFPSLRVVRSTQLASVVNNYVSLTCRDGPVITEF